MHKEDMKARMAKLRAMRGKGKGKKTAVSAKGHMTTDKDMADNKMDMRKKIMEKIGQRAKEA